MILHIHVVFIIDSCQDRVSADQYHMTVSRAQGRPIEVTNSFEVYRLQVSCSQLIAGSTLIGFLYCNVCSLTKASPSIMW